jgi:hypothetical protein
LATWFNLDEDERRTHYYVVFWLVVLIVILVFIPTSGWLRWLFVALAFYRLQDLIFSTLDNALNLTTKSLEATQCQPSKWLLTLIVLSLINIIQIVLIFAIAYLTFTGHNHKAFHNPPTGRFSEFFLSWINLPPLGGGADPRSTMAEVLSIAEEATGLLITVIAIGRFLAMADSKRSGRHHPARSIPLGPRQPAPRCIHRRPATRASPPPPTSGAGRRADPTSAPPTPLTRPVGPAP